MRTYIFLILIAILLTSGCTAEQPQPTAPVQAASADANLLQLMRGVLFPNSNVIFAAQDKKKVEVKAAEEASTATDPLLSTYGGWAAVENSGLALAESASLLMIPGRKCANGRDVPLKNEDWPKFVEALRAAGMKSYTAAQAKSEDGMLEAADAMATACMNCHDKYREKPGGDADRCM